MFSTATSIVSTINSQPRVVTVPRVSASTVVTPSQVPVSTAKPIPNPPPSVPSSKLAKTMSPNTAKHKCKGFLVTLQRMAKEQSPAVAENVKTLIQSLIDGVEDPETFTTKLQCELNSAPQPCLVPFLKRSLPYLQNSLLFGEISMNGVLPPPRTPRTRRLATNTTPGP